ncbi:MAG: hypothetical protein ACRBBV_18070 [Paracoccaceae bacterium]
MKARQTPDKEKAPQLQGLVALKANQRCRVKCVDGGGGVRPFHFPLNPKSKHKYLFLMKNIQYLAYASPIL